MTTYAIEPAFHGAEYHAVEIVSDPGDGSTRGRVRFIAHRSGGAYLRYITHLGVAEQVFGRDGGAVTIDGMDGLMRWARRHVAKLRSREARLAGFQEIAADSAALRDATRDATEEAD